MAEVRYVIANRHHLLILRSNDQGIIIEPYRKHTHPGYKDLLIPHATADYVVCEDQKGILHIVFIDQSRQLMHASIHSFEPADSELFPAPIQRIDSSLHDSPLQLQLQCVHNSLQLLLLYEHSVIHYQLAGVHWSSPTVLEQSDKYISLQTHLVSDQGIACLWINQYPDITVHIWTYTHPPAEWKLSEHAKLACGWDGSEPLFVNSSFEADTGHLLQVLRFPKGKLFLEQYILHADSTTGPLTPYRESMLLTPIRSVQTAVCVQDGEELHLSWLAEEQLYQCSYNLNRDAWGSLRSVTAVDPVHWIFLTSDHALPLSYSHWIASTGDWQQLNEQLGSFIDLYYTRRDFQSSVTYAATSISSLERLTHEKQRMMSKIDQLEETLRISREQSLMKQQRLEVLGEEREIRNTLNELLPMMHTQQQEEQSSSTFIANVHTESESEPSNKHTEQEDHEHEVHTDNISHSSIGKDNASSKLEEPAIKHKVISLLQRMTKLR